VGRKGKWKVNMDNVERRLREPYPSIVPDRWSDSRHTSHHSLVQIACA
jgi:hypothetical protein